MAYWARRGKVRQRAGELPDWGLRGAEVCWLVNWSLWGVELVGWLEIEVE